MSSDNSLQTPARPAAAETASARQQPAADHTAAPRAPGGPGGPDARTQPAPGGGAPATPPAPPARRKHLVRALIAVFALGIIGWGIWYVIVGRWYESTDNAYAQGNVVELTPQVTGTVVSIDADDGNLVRAGTPLVRQRRRWFVLCQPRGSCRLCHHPFATNAHSRPIHKPPFLRAVRTG